jgi:hypothetical protein
MRDLLHRALDFEKKGVWSHAPNDTGECGVRPLPVSAPRKPATRTKTKRGATLNDQLAGDFRRWYLDQFDDEPWWV